MFDVLLSIIAPHYCYNCGKTGSLLCKNCKKYITKKPATACLLCGRLYRGRSFCTHCQMWCLTTRTGVIGRLIDDFKFNRTYATARVLAELLDKNLPKLPAKMVLIPVPTAPANIRWRGYDHMAMVTKLLAKKRHLKYVPMIGRRNNTTQHFAKTAAQRRRQAKTFFEVVRLPESGAKYLLVDDIYTTGSTLNAARDCLLNAGATDVKCAVIVRQTNKITNDDTLNL